MITVYCYTKCTTCKKALKWLEENSISYRSADIKTNPPQRDELKKMIEKSGKPIKSFFNTSGLIYKELGLKDKLSGMSFEEQLDLLSGNGMLIKRPLLVSEDYVFPGFRENEWEKLK